MWKKLTLTVTDVAGCVWTPLRIFVIVLERVVEGDPPFGFIQTSESRVVSRK